MEQTQALLGIAAVTTFVAGPSLASFAARRAALQPVDAEPELEARVLRAALDGRIDSHSLAEAGEVFTVPAFARIAAAMAHGAGSLEQADRDTLCERCAGLEPLGGDEHVEALDVLVDVAHSRRTYQGAVPDEQGPDGVRRTRREPSRSRCLLMGAAGALTVWLAGVLAPDPAAFVALVLAGLGSIVAASIDYDTWFVDTPLVWGLAVPSVLASGVSYSRELGGLPVLVSGALLCLVALLVRVSARVYERVTGRQGALGGGDAKAALLSVAVPMLALRDPQIPAWTLVATVVVQLTVVSVGVARHRYGWRRHHPLVPALTAGWLLHATVMVVGR